MNLFLEKLVITNFEGGTLTVEFGKKTNISGANRAGKSRIKDAYHYLLTGRNAQDKADFDIKDTVNTGNNRLDHSVEGHFIKDGSKLTLERTYKEIWGADKGEAEERLKKHTTEYKINGHPKSPKEFKDMISIIIPENMLKMISDPLYFPKMNWADQRKVLELMASEVTNESVINKIATPKNDMQNIIAILNAGDTVELRQERIKYEIKKARDEHEMIKPKIDENVITINSLPSIHITAVNASISKLNDDIDKVDQQITNKVAAQDAQNDTERGLRNKLNSLKNRQADIWNELVRKVSVDANARVAGKSELEDVITRLQADKQSKENLHKSSLARKEQINEKIKVMLADFHAENKKEIPEWNEDKFICPTCKRAHENDDIEAAKLELTKNFKDQKKKRLLALNDDGKALEQELAGNTTTIQTVTAALEKINADLSAKQEELDILNKNIKNQDELPTAEQLLSQHTEHLANKVEIDQITETLAKNEPVNYDELKKQKSDLITLLDEEKKKLLSVDQKKALEDRNQVHAAREKELAQIIATLQREDSEINTFIVARMDSIEETVRSKFKYVKFKMFDVNLGDQTVKPYCEAWFEGKPYSALNTEAQLNAGLDIINALANHYNTYSPILLDNREGVSEIIEVQSQVISFFVNPECKSIKVEIEE